MEQYSYHTLGNGLRIVHARHMAGCGEYCGVVTRVGSRDESPQDYGLAHFIEHTIFKGTARRRSWHIINRMEAVGGELNAYTTKEETVVYSSFPAGNAARAVELIADLLTASVFPDNELDKEREVVADEINSYLDSPSEAVYDDFEDIVYKGTGLGHNILGTVDTLRNFDTLRCREFMDRYYVPGNMVFFYAGPEPVEKVVRMAERRFGGMSAAAPVAHDVAVPVYDIFDGVRNIGSHQSHVVTGATVQGIYGDNVYPMALLTNIIGGPGMNSLLNLALRERSGLVYTVEASTTLFSDTGLFTVYYGCDPHDCGRCRRIVHNQLERLAGTALPERRLAAYARQYIGQLTLSRDNREQSALSMGRAVMYHGRALTVPQVAERIMDITPERLRAAAELVAPVRCSSLTLG
ncbi:MAG TPA: pitrilysin family protein [Muribaculaceae bacterium]|jgi:predicted Zn-dependent peptidase|nr:pitrilysin family protein [Muribaculaceae bacterium]